MGTGPKHGADMLSYLDPSNQCSRLSDRLSIFPTQQTEQTMGIKNVFRCRVDNFVFVKLRQGAGKDRQGMALKAKSLKA